MGRTNGFRRDLLLTLKLKIKRHLCAQRLRRISTSKGIVDSQPRAVLLIKLIRIGQPSGVPHSGRVMCQNCCLIHIVHAAAGDVVFALETY